MSDSVLTLPVTYCGRLFSPEELSRVRAIISEDPGRNRNAISRLVCQEFCWYKRDGKLKEMSCRVALLRMHRAGLIVLPAPQKGNAKGTCYRAANWIHVGITRGRGKKDRKNEYARPIKDIFLYPIEKQFRKILLSI